MDAQAEASKHSPCFGDHYKNALCRMEVCLRRLDTHSQMRKIICFEIVLNRRLSICQMEYEGNFNVLKSGLGLAHLLWHVYIYLGYFFCTPLYVFLYDFFNSHGWKLFRFRTYFEMKMEKKMKGELLSIKLFFSQNSQFNEFKKFAGSRLLNALYGGLLKFP